MSYIISTNPSRNYEVLGKVKVSTQKDVKNAVVNARKAFETWSIMSLAERCKRIASFVEISKKRQEEIAQLIAKETGRPITSSRANVEGGIEYFEAYTAMAEKYLSPEVTFESAKEVHTIYKEPRGVIAAILPWNYPFMNVAWQCGQALIAGNTFIYKNSKENQLFAKLLEELIASSKIPKGVFNILYGDSSIGDMMVQEEIDMISFTGSTEVGQQLTKIAAEKFIPITTELGGSSPMIIFDDVKLTDETIAYIAGRRFKNAGQACDAVKRLIVDKKIFNELVEKLGKYVASQKVGDAMEEDTVVGPMISEKQVKAIELQVKDAIKKGAKVIKGGKRPKGLQGAYYLPTVLTNITKDMKVWHEETFGPVLPVIPFEDEAQAIRMANHTEYGLTAHVMTNDKKKFERVARQIKAGSIGQNMTGFWSPQNPFGGYKKSGMGRTHGSFGFAEATQVKVVSQEKQ